MFNKATFMSHHTLSKPVAEDSATGQPLYAARSTQELRYFFRDALRISLNSPRQALFFLRTLGPAGAGGAHARGVEAAGPARAGGDDLQRHPSLQPALQGLLCPGPAPVRQGRDERGQAAQPL